MKDIDLFKPVLISIQKIAAIGSAILSLLTTFSWLLSVLV